MREIIERFVDECLVEDPNAAVGVRDILVRYRAWIAEHPDIGPVTSGLWESERFPPNHQVMLGRRLRKVIRVSTVRRTNGVHYLGWRLR